MSTGRAAMGAAERVGSGAGRVMRAWRVLPYERRLAAGSAIGLFLALFLPWYQETVIPTASGRPGTLPSASLTGWAAFSFVEAAVLLVSAGVLTLLFMRAEGRAFHVPGGDGGVITAAGVWTCGLIVWRIFDKQGTSSHTQFVTTSGIEWGIFIALVVAATMVYAGNRIRAAHQPEPPLPGEEPLLKRDPDDRGRPNRRARTPRPVAADAPRRPRADDPARPLADAAPQPPPTAPTQVRPAAGAPPRPETPSTPPRRRRPALQSLPGAPSATEGTPGPPSGSDEAQTRPLPIELPPAESDWNVGEFRTPRAAGDDDDDR